MDVTIVSEEKSRKLSPREMMEKLRESSEKAKKIDEKMDELLERTIPSSRFEEEDSEEWEEDEENKWNFIHDVLDCDKCRKINDPDDHKLNFYEGTHDERDAHRYVCTNEECGFDEILYLDEMDGSK